MMVAMGLPHEQMEEAFRRMVLNVMGRNCDGHTKNFSFWRRQGAPGRSHRPPTSPLPTTLAESGPISTCRCSDLSKP